MQDSRLRVFDGTLGSYKSYNGVLEALETIRNGGIVFTNIPLKWDRIRMHFEDHESLIIDDKQYVVITPENAHSFVKFLSKGTRESPNKLIIDEAGLHHNSRDAKMADRTGFEMVAHARKIHIDTVFIAHDFQHINKQIRDMAQSVLRFRDLQKIKLFGIACPLPAYVFVELDARTTSIKYDSQIKFKDKKVYTFYKSHDVQCATVEAIPDKPDIEHVKLDKPTTEMVQARRFRKWFFRVLFGFIFMGLGNVFFGGEPPANAEPPPAEQELFRPARPEPVAETPRASPFSLLSSPAVSSQAEEPVRGYTSLMVSGGITLHRSIGQAPMGDTRKIPVIFDETHIVLVDGTVVTQHDSKLLGVRLSDRAVFYDNKVHYYTPDRRQSPYGGGARFSE